MSRREIYIADSHLVTSFGEGTALNFRALLAGESGLRPVVSEKRVTEGEICAGIIPDEIYSSLSERYGSDFTYPELLSSACISHITDNNAHVLHEGKTGLVLSTAKGNIITLDSRCPSGPFVPEDGDPVLLSSLAKACGRMAGIPEENVHVVSTACISGVSAIVTARRMILAGIYDHVIVTGVDVQCRFITSGFASFKSLSAGPCKPYDADRCGLNLGEACGALLLTSDRTVAGDDAVRVDGGYITDDANHISGPSRTGDGLFFAIRGAMEEAGISPEEIDAMQMHGTATLYNDEMESRAASLAGLTGVPLQSLKPYFGHTMGASGVIETILLAEQMKHGKFFGVKGFSEPGVPFRLNVSPDCREIKMHHCLKTASGFGGTNAAVVLSCGIAPKVHEGPQYRAGIASVTVRSVEISSGSVTVDGRTVFSEDAPFDEFIRAAYRHRGEQNMKFFKMDSFCKLSYIASEWLLDGLSFGEEECGVVMSGRYGSLDTDMRHQQTIDKEGEGYAAPAVFVYTLPNVAAAEISIRHHIKGENIWFCSSDRSMADIRRHAGLLLSGTGKMRYCVIGHADFINGEYLAIFEVLQRPED